MSCNICCEKYTAVQRKRVECGHCGEASCSVCLQRYLLTLQGDPHCMACKHSLDGEFLAMHLPRTWLLGSYKRHREQVLLEREMALLPATQEVLANYRFCQDLHAQLVEMDAQRRACQDQLIQLNHQAMLTRRDIDTLRNTNYVTRPEQGQRNEARERRTFVRACPADGCRGFLSSAWKCGTCEAWVCKDCGEPKAAQVDANHACDPDVAASHAMLQKDSRPCPQCAAMIFKVDGCDQMWCTQCHVAFSWRTGQVVTNGVIHNPHWYEWMRRTRGEVPRAPGDLPCGGLPTYHAVRGALARSPLTHHQTQRMYIMHREMGHLMTVDLPILRRDARADDNRNVDLRLQYLMQAVDRDEWKRKLQQREKKRERAFAVMQVYEMYVAAATDLMRGMTDGHSTPALALEGLLQLQTFANDSLASISKRFNMRVKRLRED